MALNTPDSDQRAFRDASPGLRLVLMCLFSIALMVLDNNNRYIVDARRMLSTALYPVRVVINAPFAFGGWISESFSTRNYLIAENREYSDRLLKQSARLQRMSALEAENARLRSLLESTAKVGDRVLIAEIMSVDMNPFRHSIVVNKGSQDEVYVGQAVIDAQGVVGQITRDQLYSSEAILITDIDHALPVELVRNRVRTIAVGTGDLEKLSLPFLPRNADVRSGDLLVTSGLGGSFPPGYPVGVINDVRSDTSQQFLNIIARPSAALNRIREVLIIWPGPQEKPEVEAETDPENDVATEQESLPISEAVADPDATATLEDTEEQPTAAETDDE